MTRKTLKTLRKVEGEGGANEADHTTLHKEIDFLKAENTKLKKRVDALEGK
ncbi:hypothetical protein [Kordiimonas sp. SCSIO 12610]|uniref:hypothetical protein n=1 Tax=Kordiimonas sp. SCSIO 12610 TaxID=2829597 RepID=UPI00210B6A5C|nr:hypothetical protein [Kordiimonas sp. SCSIO 12610]UTW53957.1 hypothetical protein KFF44_08895 [Kordiimonas sp. SCSIO 12610]